MNRPSHDNGSSCSPGEEDDGCAFHSAHSSIQTADSVDFSSVQGSSSYAVHSQSGGHGDIEALSGFGSGYLYLSGGEGGNDFDSDAHTLSTFALMPTFYMPTVFPAAANPTADVALSDHSLEFDLLPPRPRPAPDADAVDVPSSSSSHSIDDASYDRTAGSFAHLLTPSPMDTFKQAVRVRGLEIGRWVARRTVTV